MSSADIAHLSLTITSAESAPVPPPASGGGRSWIVYRRTLLPNMRGCAHRARPLQRRKYAGPRFSKDASRRKFDIIMAWTIDRLGRLLRGFQQIVRQLLS
jgi:hypothetical protein